MPTVLQIEGYRFFFYSRETGEPPHIHVEYGDKIAKFWLSPTELAMSKRFRSHELTLVRALVVEHLDRFLEAWNGYFHANR